ncbi:MAG: tetratricopeptide repeat protein [Bacteroidales bacterium]|nr:tetratricopeptide repeat protein [Bacteroidales bacterium]
MKRTVFNLVFKIAFVAFLLPTSCAPVRDRKILNDMEALMPERPDSALAVLRGLQPHDLPGLHVRPLHALLLSEALDKNYIDLTDDSLALAANRYYGDHGSKLHRLKSWYYLGRIRFNAGNYAEAVISYNKALEYAEALNSYHYMGLINREIANAYDSVWDTFHATERLRESVRAFQSANEETYAAYSELALASGLIKQKRYDEAKRVLNEIDDNQDDNYLLAVVRLKRAQIAVNEGADNYDEILSDYHAAGIGKTIPTTISRLSEQAVVHQLAGHTDSADFYLGLAGHAIKTKGDSVVFEYDKSQVEALRGNYSLAYELLNQTVHSQDSSVYAALRQSVSYYQSNHYQNEARMNAMKGRMRTLILGSVIILLLMLTLYLLSRNRKQRAMMVEEMARISDIHQDLLSMRSDNQEIGQAIAVLFENRLNILQTLSDQYDMVEESFRQKKSDKGRELSRDEIVDSFRGMMRNLRDDKEIGVSMEEILNTWKGGIMRKFRSVFGKDSPSNIRMSEEDFELAPYYFSGMKQKTISYLTNHTEHSIKERKRRIKQRIEALDSSFSAEKHLFLENL